jgi:hypothetical protein
MVYLLVALIFGGIGAAIGSGKGRTGLGFILGFLLSLIGVIIIALMDAAPGYAATSQPGAGGGPGTSEPGMGGPGVAGSSPSERLAKLEDLRTKGLLSDEEYAAQRQRVLGSV